MADFLRPIFDAGVVVCAFEQKIRQVGFVGLVENNAALCISAVRHAKLLYVVIKAPELKAAIVAALSRYLSRSAGGVIFDDI